MKRNKIITLLFLILITNVSVFSQSVTEEATILQSADSLHKIYKFSEASAQYKKAAALSTDTTAILAIEEKILQCENGINLLNYSSTPGVITKKSFPISDFYLNFSELYNFSWMPIPNPLVNQGRHPYYSAIYYPENSKKLFYSSPDNSGSWNIYEIDYIGGNLWTEPKLLGEEITSSGDEIFPILSSDGKELYFSSNGHYGMGGYDLYVSRFDETTGEWGVPENLGFPYSSTGDDIFYMNTPDGQYTMIASNRDSAKDSVTIYVTEYLTTPIKKAITEPDKILTLAGLPCADEIKRPATGDKITDIPRDEGMSDYSKLVSQMRIHQKELNENLKKQQENRELYDKIENEDDKQFIKEMITDLENEAIAIRLKYEGASKNVQKVEMDFLAKGIIPQIEEVPETEENKTPVTSLYIFSKNTFSEIKNIEIEKTIPKFDYSFKILETAQYAEDANLPETLVYQIQILVTSSKVSLKALKGLSPVFEKKQPSGKYLYTTGLFYSHAEALSCLNQVRKVGFPKAFIVAYNKGKSINVRDAKLLEKKISTGEGTTYQVLLKNYPDGIPSPIISAIRESCDKDIAKSVIEGKIIYIIGPFSNKLDADYVVSILSGLSVEGISVEPIKL